MEEHRLEERDDSRIRLIRGSEIVVDSTTL